jgi:hypothetical protein
MKAAILLLIVTAIGGAQVLMVGQEAPRETQVRRDWVDPTTGLMWAGKDNGKAVTWRRAESYCRSLQLAGFRDWRLATLDELATLVDPSASAPKGSGDSETVTLNLGNRSPHVRGNLVLTGNPWSSDRSLDRFGRPYGDGSFFDFVASKPSADLPHFRNTKFALCVRRP